MARIKPHIDLGTITKRRDRESFRNFVLEVIDDTFIYEFTPTSISLDGELFTIVLGPVDNSTPADSDYVDFGDIKGYRFIYEDLQVSAIEDFVDVYLYGVKQTSDRYEVQVFKESTRINSNFSDGDEIRFVFNQSITRIPGDVVRTDFEIKGKIAEIL